MEVTGSNAGSDAEPKFDLLCQQIGTRTGKRVVVRYQKDTAGPHQDKKLVDHLNEQFDVRYWMLAFQPFNSPICNTNDDCFFPALSKRIPGLQGVTNGSRVFVPDELWAAVEKCWDDFPLDTLARSYVRHAQIVSAIASFGGGDEFVRERNGLHYNVRKCCFTVCGDSGNPTGVELMESIEPSEGGGEEKLLYSKPTFRDEHMLRETIALMTPAEIRTLYYGLPVTNAFVAIEGVGDDDE